MHHMSRRGATRTAYSSIPQRRIVTVASRLYRLQASTRFAHMKKLLQVLAASKPLQRRHLSTDEAYLFPLVVSVFHNLLGLGLLSDNDLLRSLGWTYDTLLHMSPC
jgi:hypothetical protein